MKTEKNNFRISINGTMTEKASIKLFEQKEVRSI